MRFLSKYWLNMTNAYFSLDEHTCDAKVGVLDEQR